MLLAQSMPTLTVAKRQKLRRASSELNIPKAKAAIVAKEVMVMDGPAYERA